MHLCGRVIVDEEEDLLFVSLDSADCAAAFIKAHRHESDRIAPSRSELCAVAHNDMFPLHESIQNFEDSNQAFSAELFSR